MNLERYIRNENNRCLRQGIGTKQREETVEGNFFTPFLSFKIFDPYDFSTYTNDYICAGVGGDK